MYLSIFVFFTVLSTPCAARLIENVTGVGFSNLLTKNDIILATFTSRSDKTLHSFHNVYESVAATVKTPFAIIDCELEQELCGEFDVNAYPAIKLFKRRNENERRGNENGNSNTEEIIRYRGRRTKRAIQSFVTKHEQPVLTHVHPSTIEAFKKVDDVVFIAYLRPDQKVLLEVFTSIAEKHHQNFVFGYSTDMSTADAEGVGLPSIVCFKNIDGDNLVLNGHFNKDAVEGFLDSAPKSLIGEFTERTMSAYMAPGKLSVYIFAASEDDEIAARHELSSVARKFEKVVTFGIADAIEYAPMAQNFGLSNEKFPALAVHAPVNDNVFTYRQGSRIQASTVETMLMTILQAKATSGQVFGDDAPEMEEAGEAVAEEKTHDEL